MKATPREDYADRATPAVTPETSAENGVEIPYAEKHPEYHNITSDITSKFIFYPFDTLSIKTFDLGVIRKIFRAVSLQRVEPIVEALSSCIDPDKSVRDLTVQDFWSLMMWERINSYKKSPYKLNFVCTNPDHEDAVKSGELKADTLQNETKIGKIGELKLKWIDEAAVAKLIEQTHKDYGVYLFPPTVADMLEMERLQESFKDKEDDLAEMAWLSRLASNVNRTHGVTLKQRMDFLTNSGLDPDLISVIEEFIKLSDHGISEHVNVQCATCKAKREVEVSFDALSFFPDYK